MPHPRLIGAGAMLLALAAAAVLWPRETAAPPEPTSVVVEAPPLRLDQRLADAGARLVRSVSGEKTRRIPAPEPRLSVFGGAVSPAPPASALIRTVYRTIVPGQKVEEGVCGGALLAGGWIKTAAHCVAGSWERLEVWIEPDSRAVADPYNPSGSARAAYVIGEAAVHLLYRGCGHGNDVCQDDHALIKLPDDPGGGDLWPQTAQTAVEIGEMIEVCGFGQWERGILSEVWRCVEMPVVEVQPWGFRMDGSSGRFGEGDSGGPLRRKATGTQIGTTSFFEGGDPTRQWGGPWPGGWARGVREAWGD